ncbi:NUDIX domain-containing protein [Kineococcus sp. NUM-3379]
MPRVDAPPGDPEDHRENHREDHGVDAREGGGGAAGAEAVALLGPDGRVCGQAPRERVRRLNLPHAATGVLLRDARGAVYVHRRTDTKDVYPGAHDCLAGGVVGAGEDPDEAAQRELAEELGVHGVGLRPVLRAWYRDERTHYLAHVYEGRWEERLHGPVRHQVEEVAWGAWTSPARLARLLADESWPFVPDSRALLARWPGGLLPRP